MAPRKKAAKNQPQAALPSALARAPAAGIPVEPQPGTDLAGYPEVQQNEYLATEAIYPDGFLRLHGKKDAWKVICLDLMKSDLLLTVSRIKKTSRSKYG